MFSVIFEVHPAPDRWDAYLDTARMLRPELEQIDGFIDNIRYKSLTRPGWLLSLSSWRDEKALVRWRTQMRHHEAQANGRGGILLDYHLRVGEMTHDTQSPDGYAPHAQRLDETRTGTATTITLATARCRAADADAVAASLGLPKDAPGLVAWDAFDAILTPGDAILLMSWKNPNAAQAGSAALPRDARVRQVRVIRDYGMFDRREAPQYYPDAPGRETLHA
ncbi:MAG TPA: antibiotic biosynthesis monooxygenase [Rhodopila sp.]|uniref:antibiotic biosynthesis monooxygenase family protein n=1 Tax=Rhodopila sp. TaxID=2480087 RepID=UPI002B56A635|nr:antibiotic biosynthesis monooxygenase [Rhodopila sp.]HVY16059.1 antibiotic biosynthesis monooxygenase [Rhodopila sp.]